MREDFNNPSVPEPEPTLTSYQQIVAAWNRRPLSNRVGSRRFRRRLVVATYAGWLVVAVIVKLMNWNSPHSWTAFVLLTANLTVQMIWVGRRTYINTPELKDAELDERLVQIRNRAFRTAFRAFAPYVLIGWVLSMVAMTLQPGERGLANAVLIFFGAALLATTLPTTIVAWREPDPTEPELRSA